MQLRNRKLAGLLLTATLLVPLAGCGDSPVDPTQNFVNPSTVRVRNNLMGPVLFFFTRSCGTTAWSEDLLPNDPVNGTIQPGTSKDFTVEAGCYDLWAQHLETAEPGPLIDKMISNQIASPVTPLVWVLDETANGPS